MASAASLAGGACAEPEVVTTCCLVSFVVQPASAELAPGDTLPVRVIVVGGRAAASVRLRSTRPAVARLDTVVAAGAAAVLRAVGPGADTVQVWVRVERDSAPGWIPILVRPRL